MVGGSLSFYRHGSDALDFYNLSGCEQLMRGPAHIAGNRVDLVMADVPYIVDVVVNWNSTRLFR